MQYHIETVDPKFLDLKQFPLSPSLDDHSAPTLSAGLRRSDDSFVTEDIHLGFRNQPISGGPRRSSDDQLEILGPFEFANTYFSAQEPSRQTHTWEDEPELYSPGTPESISNRVQSLNHAAPWNHLDAFEYSGIQRHLRGLGIKPAHSTYTTPRTSPSDIIAPEERTWNPISLEDFKVPYRYVESSPVIPFVYQGFPPDQPYRVGNEIHSGISPTSGTQPWPDSSPPDSAVVFPSNDSIADSRYADLTESYGFRAPEVVQQLATAIKLETPDIQPRHTPSHDTIYPTQPDDYHLAENRRISKDTGYETVDHALKGISQSQTENPLIKQDYATRRHIRSVRDQKTESPGEESIEETSIEGTGEPFLPNIASSFPPTAGACPEYWPSMANKQNSRNSADPKQPSSPGALRPATRTPRVNRKSISANEAPLSAIHEHGKSAPATSTTRKGRRAGPLSKAKATQAAIIRKNKSVCIRCKMMKQSCSGEVPCVGCRENLGAKIWKSPCVKADFLDIVEAGSCNYISQRRINHFTLDQSRRVTMLLPETFKLTELLDLLKPRLSRFNIHARQLSGPLYTLDLAKCYDFLTEIHNVQESEVFELRDFIDNKLLKVSDWLKCVTEPCSMTESLALLAKWSNMPSRASYDIVSLVDGVSDRPMNVEDPEDVKEIVIAAQLSRIICRALEVAAYRFLQKELNNLAKKSNEDAERFVQELGQILLTLRWRISWWQILGDGSKVRDDCTERYIDRVNSLTRVLYFYYCNTKKKLPSWTDPQSLRGVRSNYADTEIPVFDDFPCFDSIDGFNEWMKHGHELIHQAGVQQRLSRY